MELEVRVSLTCLGSGSSTAYQLQGHRSILLFTATLACSHCKRLTRLECVIAILSGHSCKCAAMSVFSWCIYNNYVKGLCDSDTYTIESAKYRRVTRPFLEGSPERRARWQGRLGSTGTTGQIWAEGQNTKTQSWDTRAIILVSLCITQIGDR